VIKAAIAGISKGAIRKIGLSPKIVAAKTPAMIHTTPWAPALPQNTKYPVMLPAAVKMDIHPEVAQSIPNAKG
jgi:hypothetical protein